MSLPTPSPLPTHVVQDYFDKTRVLFGQHSGGYVVPVRMHLQLADDAFTGFIHPLACDEEFIFFLAESRTVCAATQTSILLLGVCGWCLVLSCLCRQHSKLLFPARSSGCGIDAEQR